MNPIQDRSLDATDLLDHDELQLSNFDEFESPVSPQKRSSTESSKSHSKIPIPALASLASTPFPDLRLSTNDLFQVTTHLRNKHKMGELGKHEQLHNNKIDKLLSQLLENDEDLELDDQLRTRVFKARLNNTKQPLDALDLLLDSYLLQGLADQQKSQTRSRKHRNDDKENTPGPLLPSKKRRIPKTEKPSKTNPPRLIPSLKPLTNITDIFANPSQNTSPRRVCSPRSADFHPNKPCLRNRKAEPVHIYTVESLTGLINDATQFGTELNASNCEGFLMPDSTNEIVKIPTNEVGPSARKKMAIIRAHHSKRFPCTKDAESSEPSTTKFSDSQNILGFYSKKEFEDLRGEPGHKPVKVHRDVKAVRWADELEW